MTAPTPQDTLDYLGPDSGWEIEDITDAYDAEKAAQASACNVPDDADEWPADLTEALFRRVAHNLAVRSLPLGVQAFVGEVSSSQVRISGRNAEVVRMERPYRKLVVA